MHTIARWPQYWCKLKIVKSIKLIKQYICFALRFQIVCDMNQSIYNFNFIHKPSTAIVRSINVVSNSIVQLINFSGSNRDSALCLIGSSFTYVQSAETYLCSEANFCIGLSVKSEMPQQWKLLIISYCILHFHVMCEQTNTYIHTFGKI